MAFRKHKQEDNEDDKVTQNEFCIFLKKKPEKVKIVKVGELQENKFKSTDNKQTDYYFYIDFTSETFTDPVSVSYTANIDDDGVLIIKKGHKLHKIASYLSELDDDIEIDFDELADELVGAEFKAKAIRKSFGSNYYYIIVPVEDEV